MELPGASQNKHLNAGNCDLLCGLITRSVSTRLRKLTFLEPVLTEMQLNEYQNATFKYSAKFYMTFFRFVFLNRLYFLFLPQRNKKFFEHIRCRKKNSLRYF